MSSTTFTGQEAIARALSAEACRLDEQFLAGIERWEDWERRRPVLYAQYLDMLGLWPLPERTPLRAQVTGVIERPDAGDGVRIEKLHFQSRPCLYVTGNLYLPMHLPASERLPAVLYVCGHWSQAGRSGNKTVPQHHGLWFATHGYVCLIIDTLQLGEIAGVHHGTHHLERWWWQARGYTPAGVECWNGIRAIDYLVSRPEVDVERIAVTGISGGGAATFWIAAADERVKVAVPVSGMSDLEEYVGNRILNRQCDCMFLPNTYRWPWTTIAALIAPRPLLIENAGHDPYFPMAGNERIRARLERLYRLYTDRPETLFDIAVVPGNHDDGPELRLMAYRWINRHLKGDTSPVVEPEVPPLPGEALRVFPDELPADALNSTVDEWFVPAARMVLPRSEDEFSAWREQQLGRLRSLSFRALLDGEGVATPGGAALGATLEERRSAAGYLRTAAGVEVAWRSVPAGAMRGETPGRRGERGQPASHRPTAADVLWTIILDVQESLDSVPVWAHGIVGRGAILLVAPRGAGPLRWPEGPPYPEGRPSFVRRAHALLGQTVDGGRVADVLDLLLGLCALPARVLPSAGVKIAGRGRAGIIGAYAALLAPPPLVKEVVVVDPPRTHRDGPIFLNVLRVTDIPEALGLLAPRPLTIRTSSPEAFERTAQIYHTAGSAVTMVAKGRESA